MNLRVQSYGALYFLKYSQFTQTGNYIRSETASIQKENNKDDFRRKCLALNTNVISRIPRTKYIDQNRWKGALRTFYENYHAVLTKYGGCPMILDENDKELLVLNYEAEDFCEQKQEYLKYLNKFKEKGNKYNCKSDTNCIRKCREYNVWINERKVHFNNKKVQLYKNCRSKKHLSQFPTKSCNILKSNIFSTLNECKGKNSVTFSPSTSKEEKTPLRVVGQNTVNSPPTDQVPAQEVMQDSLKGPTETKEKTTDQEKQSVSQTVTQAPPSEATSSSQSQSAEIQNIQYELDTTSKASSQSENEALLSPGSNILQNQVSQITMAPSSTETISSHSRTSLLSSTSSNSNDPLKIIVPSFSSNKSELFTDYRLEHPKYDDEEIIKKIKINELTKNVYLSKRKKDRSRTIIEVHMEVLEECRNEELEKNKEEFLKICIDELAKEDYRAYPNSTDDDLIIENIKCSDDITKQNILWNKWIERHRNISEKLKKVHWINNLKN
ncbi:surface-associated interspersed protein 8.2 (SURFIN 8.2) (SURF8.2), partial [Plasmodium malariae]